MTSRYGAEFDDLVDRWAMLEREHDEMHSECDGVGGCSMMMRGHQLEELIIEELNVWRQR